MTHQNLSPGMWWKLFWATLKWLAKKIRLLETINITPFAVAILRWNELKCLRNHISIICWSFWQFGSFINKMSNLSIDNGCRCTISHEKSEEKKICCFWLIGFKVKCQLTAMRSVVRRSFRRNGCRFSQCVNFFDLAPNHFQMDVYITY